MSSGQQSWSKDEEETKWAAACAQMQTRSKEELVRALLEIQGTLRSWKFDNTVSLHSSRWKQLDRMLEAISNLLEARQSKPLAADTQPGGKHEQPR